jgi:hypothetical protein
MTNTLQTFVKERNALKSKLAAGTLKLPDLTKALAQPEDPALPVKKVPLPAVITDEQEVALAELRKVYGKVVPTEARALTPVEVDALMTERLTLDEVEKLAKARKDAIRTTVLNHIDSEYGTDTKDGYAVGDAASDKEGHVLCPTKVLSSEHGNAFSWEISNRGGTLDVSALKALDAEGRIDHTLYLEMTDQTRVVNENKVMLVLQAHPELIDVLGEAVTKTNQVGSLYVRGTK